MRKIVTVVTQNDYIVLRWSTEDTNCVAYVIQPEDVRCIATRLVNEGYAILDPSHQLDMMGILSEPYQSQIALNQDCADYGYRGSWQSNRKELACLRLLIT
jgi:hypothetical protein